MREEEVTISTTNQKAKPPKKLQKKEESLKEGTSKFPKRDDELWKGILSDVFEDFLRFFLPNADELVNMKKKFSFMDKEFNRLFPPEENTAGVRFVDKLAKVHLNAGGEKFILVHIEVQGHRSKEDLGLRMLRYWYRAKDKHNVSITAFAILIDEIKKYRPKFYQEEYLGTKISYEFNSYKLLDQNEAELRANPNPFAVVVLVAFLALKNKGVNDETLKQIKLDLTKELIKRKVSKPKYNKLMAFLTHYVNFENPETMSIFTKEVEQLTGNTEPMGVLEILAERRAKDIAKDIAKDMANEMAKDLANDIVKQKLEKTTDQVTDQVTERVTEQKNHSVVENLIEQFGFSDEQAAKVAEVSITFVKKVRKKLETKKEAL